MTRLDALISNSGAYSRSEIKIMVKKGRVSVNGQTVKDYSLKVSENDVISVDGKILDTEKFVYIMLNKPAGYVCANDEPDSVLTLVPKEFYRKGLFTVGRLDKDTEGLLLITNDGDFGHSVAAPSRNITKIYYADLEREVNDDDIKAFASGLTSKNGDSFASAILEKGEGKSALITVSEGSITRSNASFL